MSERHQLIYLRCHEDLVIHSCHADRGSLHLPIRAWLGKGLPCIYARQEIKEGSRINLGLPLLIANKKHALGFSVDKGALLKEQSLPHLISMLDFFRDSYQINNILDRLTSSVPRFANFDFISVYGSFLFAYLSGQDFVRKQSDLDLLIEYPNCSLAQLNELIHCIHKIFGRTIDGEVRFQQLGDFSLKELVDVSAKTLLVKKRDSIELLARSELYACYPALCSN